MLSLIKRHPVGQWLLKHFGTIMVVMPIVTGVWAVWWTFEQDRQFNMVWEAKDVEWNESILSELGKIREEQKAVRTELATQTFSLSDLRDAAQEAEDDIKKLGDQLGDARAAASYQRGEHMGQHTRFESAVNKLEEVLNDGAIQ